MIFGNPIPVRYASQWLRDGRDRYRRVGGCEIVCDRRGPDWRAMVPVYNASGRSAAWQALTRDGRVTLFQTATTAIEAVEYYLAMSSRITEWDHR